MSPRVKCISAVLAVCALRMSQSMAALTITGLVMVT